LTEMKVKENIPNFITCLNLLCGCIGIVLAFEGNLVWSAYLVGIAAVLDFLDGFTARILKVHSAIGKQLDSLADMVTFGVLPGVVMFNLLEQAYFYELFSEYWTPLPNDFREMWYDTRSINFVPYLAFLIPVFSAIRLAKFNLDSRQSDSFIGLPTPANSIFICSLVLILSYGDEVSRHFMSAQSLDVFMEKGPGEIWDLIHHKESGSVFWRSNLILSHYFLLLITTIFSVLLVSPIRLFALKFKNFGWADNKVRYIFLALSAALLILFQVLGIPLIIVLYIVLSVINNLVKHK